MFSPQLRPPLANTSAPRDSEPLSSEQDVLAKWQEERMQRRLRGEYESQMIRLGELVWFFFLLFTNCAFLRTLFSR